MRLSRVRNVLFDLDGCVWFGGCAAPHAPEVVAELRARGYRVFFLTNSSAATAESLAAKLAGLGIPAEPAEVLAPLTVAHQHPALANGAEALVLGKPAVTDALRRAGVTVTTDAKEAQVVVVGNSGDLTFADLTPALRALDRGATLLALNLDRRVPTDTGFIPGTGAIVAALEAAGSAEAELVGKPSRFYFERALERFRVRAEESLMVGDSPDTDIVGGRSAGMATILVGGATPELDEHRPDLQVHGLEELLVHMAGSVETAP